ncbi:MAG: sigma-70 family RNA polymerase sigma factor [Bacteroidetes bacterium]|nr:sigma-70 family RNA polymerase sigma factor [Bacteroidota bacterium]
MHLWIKKLFQNRKYNFSSLTDQELIELFVQKNDSRIIAALYQRYGHLVFGVCMKYLKHIQNAEDLTIELFSDLPQKLKNHKILHFKSWLYITTKNSCLMILRKKNEFKSNIHDQIVDEAEEDSLSSKEILETKLEALEIALEEINEKQATCIKAFYLEKRCYDEISRMHSLTLHEVKSHIQNGKRNLKIILSKLISEK